jgi:hypothetical protein
MRLDVSLERRSGQVTAHPERIHPTVSRRNRRGAACQALAIVAVKWGLAIVAVKWGLWTLTVRVVRQPDEV